MNVIEDSYYCHFSIKLNKIISKMTKSLLQDKIHNEQSGTLCFISFVYALKQLMK